MGQFFLVNGRARKERDGLQGLRARRERGKFTAKSHWQAPAQFLDETRLSVVAKERRSATCCLRAVYVLCSD